MDLSFMPAINATLNAMACVCLIVGLVAIKRRRVELHRRLMLSATAFTGLFLVCYVIHYVWRAMEKGGLHTRYHGVGLARTFYYSGVVEPYCPGGLGADLRGVADPASNDGPV